MKKNVIVLLGVCLLLLLGGCNQGQEENVLKVGASPLPHGELLHLIEEDLAKEGIRLEVIEFTDYVKPNIALEEGELDANFFQHLPYLENFNKEHGYALRSAGNVHVEPLGLYAKGKIELEKGSVVALPNDAVNGARALILLAHHDYISLKEGAGLEATIRDIVENPLGLSFVEVEAAQLPRILADVDAAIINGNYALEAGLNPAQDALLLEGASSPYANILVVRPDRVEDEQIKKLINLLQSDKVKDFILQEYGGGVVPAF